MPTPMNASLDDKILKAIKAGNKHFAEIVKATNPADWRWLDSRLQYLRRKGLIHYRKGTGYGWYLGTQENS